MKIVIANSNPILEQRMNEALSTHSVKMITSKDELNLRMLDEFKPEYIFFPHWSFIIPEKIFSKYECIVFHMTDLPFGRGGSPLQNLIARGLTKTKISALRVDKGIDTGDIFLKRELLLLGTAEEIFLRSADIILEMINEIVDKKITPEVQTGPITTFKRRKPKQSNLEEINDAKELFNFIRMLDAEGYPNAFIETKYFKFEFTRASLKKDSIIADVRITQR